MANVTYNPFMSFGVLAEPDEYTYDFKARAKRLADLLIEIAKRIGQLILRLFMIPFNFLQGIFHPELLAERNLKRAAANKAAVAEDMEAALERRMQRRLQSRLTPAPREKTTAEIVSDALRDIADMRALDAIALGGIPTDWFAWIDNLTPDEAREALKHPVEDVLMHLHGETVLPGVRPILTAAERVESKAALDKAAQASARYRYGDSPAEPLPDVVEPESMAWGFGR